MFEAFKKLFAFSGEYRKLWYKAFFFDVLRCIFEALQFFPLFLVLKGLAEQNVTAELAWTSLAIMAVSILGQALLYYFSHQRSMIASYMICDEKRITIGEHLKYMPMGYFSKKNLTNITAVCTSTMEDMESMTGAIILRLFIGIVHSAVLSLGLTIFDWRIGLIYFVGILVFMLVNSQMLKVSRKYSPERLQAQIELNDAALEFVQGMGVARAFRLDKQANTAMEKSIDKSERWNFALEKKSIPFTFAQKCVLRIFSVIALIVSIALTLNGQMDVFVCLLMIVAAFFVYEQVEVAGSMSFMLPMIDASIDRINAIEDIPLVEGKEGAAKPQSCTIEFKNVDFSYENRKVIENANLVIPEKSSCAIVGPSGSGKTTFANLMTRFWDVNAGSISLGGVNVNDLAPDELMSYYSMVFQDVYLFNDTIENNIKFGKPEANHEEVIAAAQAARCEDFIAALPHGYQTILGEGGATISGGEKQRISIARAIIKDAPIVILDEATANVDPENEADLQEAIEALMHDKTIVMIAHRLKTVRHADQIVVLDKGNIVARGKHEDLINQPGIYQDFVNMRTKAISWKLGITV